MVCTPSNKVASAPPPRFSLFRPAQLGGRTTFAVDSAQHCRACTDRTQPFACGTSDLCVVEHPTGRLTLLTPGSDFAGIRHARAHHCTQLSFWYQSICLEPSTRCASSGRLSPHASARTPKRHRQVRRKTTRTQSAGARSRWHQYCCRWRRSGRCKRRLRVLRT